MKEFDANKLPLGMGNHRIPLKISVIHTADLNDIYRNLPEGITGMPKMSCPRFREGDTFMVTDKGGKPPRDFPCAWAWHDLFQVVLGLQLGGNYPPFADGIFYASCTSGLHPVFFKLERMSE